MDFNCYVRLSETNTGISYKMIEVTLPNSVLVGGTPSQPYRTRKAHLDEEIFLTMGIFTPAKRLLRPQTPSSTCTRMSFKAACKSSVKRSFRAAKVRSASLKALACYTPNREGFLDAEDADVFARPLREVSPDGLHRPSLPPKPRVCLFPRRSPKKRPNSSPGKSGQDVAKKLYVGPSVEEPNFGGSEDRTSDMPPPGTPLTMSKIKKVFCKRLSLTPRIFRSGSSLSLQKDCSVNKSLELKEDRRVSLNNWTTCSCHLTDDR